VFGSFMVLENIEWSVYDPVILYLQL